MCGSNEPRLACGIAQRLANLGDETGKIGLGYKRCRPELLVQFLLGQGTGAVSDENSQQVDGFWREVQLLLAA